MFTFSQRINCHSINCAGTLDANLTADKVIFTPTCPATILINFNPELTQNKSLAYRFIRIRHK